VSHDHDVQGANGERDPQEQEQLARDLGESLTDLFVEFVKGEVSFDSVVFESFQSIQDLFVIASGEYEIEYVEESDEHDHSH
jgi:hypothetical protein